MRQYIIALFAAVILLSTSCITVSENADKAAGSGTSPAVQENVNEKVQVKKTIYIPNVVRETSFFNDGYVEGYTTYTYDEEMVLVREDLFDSFDQILESAVYESGAEGVVTRMLYNNRGVLQSSKIIVNTSFGKPETVSVIDSEGGVQTTSSYEYDADGNKVKWMVADNGGVTLSETLYQYENNLLMKIEIYNAGGKLQESFNNEYADGKLDRTNNNDADGNLKYGTEYGYDGDNLVSEKYLRSNGSTYRTVIFSNDDKGNPVKEEFFDGNGDLKDSLVREYEYSTEEILIWE
jgi:hypothetical protein